MDKKEKLTFEQRFMRLKPVRKVVLFLDGIFPPGFEGASLYNVFQFFFRGIFNSRFNLYAGSLSWNFFLAIFPSMIFLFTLIAYFPGYNFERAIFKWMNAFLPKDTYKLIKDTIADIVHNQRSGLLSIGFFAALFFASNGVFSMMLAFDSNFNESEKKKRNFFQKRFKSILLTIGITTLILLLLTVLIGGNQMSSYIIKHEILNRTAMLFFIKALQFLCLITLVFFIMSSLYYFGHSSKLKFKFFSPGAIVATILSLAATYGFSHYVESFDSYNKLYGSIGAIIVLMLLIYFNTLCVLVGFELNKSIKTVVKIAQEKRKLENRFMN